MAVEQLIFTELPAGKGLRPEATGYQIKACSSELPASAREFLSNLCAHYGDAVYRHAPRRAKESERSWRARHERLTDVPEEVLDEFPRAVCYTRLRQDLFALTQVRYYGRTKSDGRLGNFFAHSLVFAPEMLVETGGNPLALARSGALRGEDTSDDTMLPSMPALPGSAAGPEVCRLLSDGLWKEHVPALVEALATAASKARSVVLCLSDWRQAEPLVESLLETLPAVARARTTVCTYESDRNWRPPADERGDGRTAAHHLLVLCGDDERAFNLRADEYESRFAVFNFVGGRFSKLGEPGPYAAFAAACILEQRPERLHRHHALVERLGVSGEPAAWDLLVPVVSLKEGEPTLATAVHCLTKLAIRPGQVRSAMEILLPHVRTLAAGDAAEALAELGQDLGLLCDRLAAGEPEAPPQPLEAMRDLAGKALAEGRMRTAAALLDACGRERDRLLAELLHEVLDRPPAPAAVADSEVWLDLLLEGLNPAREGSAPEGLGERLLGAAFRTAADTDRVGQLWEGRGGQLVRSRLERQTDDAGKGLALELLQWITAERCAAAHAWLQLELLTRDLAPDEVVDRLVGAAEAAARSAEKTLTAKLIAMARERFPEAPARGLVLGRMAQVTVGTAAYEVLHSAYVKVVAKLKDKRRDTVHRRLAAAGAEQVLCDELLAQVLPWSGGESRAELDRWHERLGDRATLWDRLSHEVATRLARARNREDVLPLARALLRRRSDGTPPSARMALVGAVALALPLAPLSESWQRLLTPLPEGVPAPAAARLRILEWMVRIEHPTKEKDWSASQFPIPDPTWRQDVKSLSDGDQERMLAWCLEILASHGFSEPEQAKVAIRLFQAVDRGSPDALAASMSRLLRDRDPVTRVLVATAFARGVLESPRWHPDNAIWLAALVRRFDRSTRRLLARHLRHRFGFRDREYETLLDRLGEAAGLPGLGSTAAPEAGASREAPAPGPYRSHRILGFLLRSLGRREG